MIKNFLLLSNPLNESYLPLFETPKGSEYEKKKKIAIKKPIQITLLENAYNETLESVKQSFPQYIRELEGVADGAQVEFHKVKEQTNKNTN